MRYIPPLEEVTTYAAAAIRAWQDLQLSIPVLPIPAVDRLSVVSVRAGTMRGVLIVSSGLAGWQRILSSVAKHRTS